MNSGSVRLTVPTGWTTPQTTGNNNSAGKITRLTSMFDSGRLPYATYQALVDIAAEKPLP